MNESGQKLEGGDQMSEIGDRRSEVRKKAEVRGRGFELNRSKPQIVNSRGFEFAKEPSPGMCPVVVGGACGDAENLGPFLQRLAADVARPFQFRPRSRGEFRPRSRIRLLRVRRSGPPYSIQRRP